MQRLIINGDPGIRKGAVIEFAGDEYVCFSITRNGDYHGPARVQLMCVIGTPEETEQFAKRQYVPHFLDTEAMDADEITVIESKGDLTF